MTEEEGMTKSSVYLRNYKLIEIDECCKTCDHLVEGETSLVALTCPYQNGVVAYNGICDEYDPKE
jgi:hypothetical protein